MSCSQPFFYTLTNLNERRKYFFHIRENIFKFLKDSYRFAARSKTDEGNSIPKDFATSALT